MQHTKTVKVPAQPETTRNEYEKTVCDLCGAETSSIPLDGEIDWSGRYGYEFDRTTIRHSSGYNYGSDGGERTNEWFEICVNCWTEKVVPVIKDLGADVYAETNSF